MPDDDKSWTPVRPICTKLSSVYMFYFCHLSLHSVNFIVSDCYIIDVKLGLALCTAGLVNVLYLIKATEMNFYLRIHLTSD